MEALQRSPAPLAACVDAAGTAAAAATTPAMIVNRTRTAFTARGR
jgi:hypothetical protein